LAETETEVVDAEGNREVRRVEAAMTWSVDGRIEYNRPENLTVPGAKGHVSFRAQLQ
jgi:hypothetical protein